jgi:hypothetical protein
MIPDLGDCRTVALLLSGSLLQGLALAALLPPWEGFDEVAHYSYIYQLTETGTWSRLGDKQSAESDAEPTRPSRLSPVYADVELAVGDLHLPKFEHSNPRVRFDQRKPGFESPLKPAPRNGHQADPNAVKPQG